LLAGFTILILTRELMISRPDLLWPSATLWRFEISWKLIFLTVIWPSIFYLGFLKNFFRKSVKTRVYQAFFILAALFSLIILVLPTYIYSKTLVFAQIFVVFASFYCLFCTAHAAYRKESGAKLALAGGFVLLLSLVSDVLYARGLTFLPLNMISFGVIVFILFQSQIVGIRFAKAFRRAEHLSRSLRQEVERQTRDIKSILRSINQGIFTIRAPNLSVGDDHSHYLNEIIGNNIADRGVFEVFFAHTDLSENDQDQIKTVLDFSIGEDALAFEGNDHCFPRELVFHNSSRDEPRYLELDWSPIVNQQEVVEKILVCIRDVTEIRNLRDEAAQNREELKMIGQILNVPAARFFRFIKQARDFVEDNRLILLNQASFEQPQALRELYVNMHTLKGMARTYHFSFLTNAVHETEQFYSYLQKNPTHWDQVRLLGELAEVSRILDAYRKISTDKLGRKENLDHIILPHSEWKELVTTIQTLAQDDLSSSARQLTDNCVQMVSRYYYTPVNEIFAEVLSGIDSLAIELGKTPPKIVVQSSNCGVTEEGAELLINILIHLIRNALDHGIETAEERLKKGKIDAGEIRILLCDTDEGLLLQFWDDGPGLNLTKIRSLGQDRGLIAAGKQVTIEELAALIFQSGFSTKSEATAVSGRGVGMDAVRVYLQRFGGDIQIRLVETNNSGDFQPFQFRILMPHDLFDQMPAA